jgi:hypothetical protein
VGEKRETKSGIFRPTEQTALCTIISLAFEPTTALFFLDLQLGGDRF